MLALAIKRTRLFGTASKSERRSLVILITVVTALADAALDLSW